MSRKGDRKRAKRQKWVVRYAVFISEMQRREGVDLLEVDRQKWWWKDAYNRYRHKWAIEDKNKAVPGLSAAVEMLMDERLGGP